MDMNKLFKTSSMTGSAAVPTAARPGAGEWEVEAAVDAVFKADDMDDEEEEDKNEEADEKQNDDDKEGEEEDQMS